MSASCSLSLIRQLITSFVDSQLPSEPEIECPIPVPSEWPTSGHLQVEKLSAAYDHDLPNVLHDVSFEVKPAERVGIVGRTSVWVPIASWSVS